MEDLYDTIIKREIISITVAWRECIAILFDDFEINCLYSKVYIYYLL